MFKLHNKFSIVFIEALFLIKPYNFDPTIQTVSLGEEDENINPGLKIVKVDNGVSMFKVVDRSKGYVSIDLIDNPEVSMSVLDDQIYNQNSLVITSIFTGSSSQLWKKVKQSGNQYAFKLKGNKNFALAMNYKLNRLVIRTIQNGEFNDNQIFDLEEVDTTEIEFFNEVYCLPNVCQCSNGIPATGPACLQHDWEEDICAECDVGYHSDRDPLSSAVRCVPNVCKCELEYTRELVDGPEILINGKVPAVCEVVQGEVPGWVSSPNFDLCQYEYNGKIESSENFDLVKGRIQDETETSPIYLEGHGYQNTTDIDTYWSAAVYRIKKKGGEEFISFAKADSDGNCWFELNSSGYGIGPNDPDMRCAFIDSTLLEEVLFKQVGIAVTGEQCTVDGANYCEKCYENDVTGYYHKESHPNDKTKSVCKENVCICDRNGDGGIPIEFPKCTEHGGTQCEECSSQFYEPVPVGGNSKDIPCERIPCSCPHGIPKTNGDCSYVDNIKCEACDSGYVLNDEEVCVPRCNCVHGTPVTGDDCPGPFIEKCKQCDNGYYLDAATLTCLPNKCYCANGEGVISSDKQLCLNHNDPALPNCAECDNFYHLEPTAVDISRNECQQNKCRCDEGVVVPNERCRIHRETQCDDCFDIGFKLDDNQRCIPKFCQCDNGIGVHDGTCFDEVMNICLDCDDGYKLELKKQEYYKLKYAVDDPKHPYTVYNDPNISEKQVYWGGFCEKLICEEDEVVEGNECVDKVYETPCVCDFGHPAEDEECLDLQNASNNTETHFCDACESGFYLTDDNKCECKACQCENGHALADGTCFDENDHRCVECFDGFKLTRNYDDDGHCYEEVCTKVNQCYCEHGLALQGDGCFADGAHACSSCISDGYFLDAQGVCVAKICPCENGWGASGGACFNSDRQMCEACDWGFEILVVNQGLYFEKQCVDSNSMTTGPILVTTEQPTTEQPTTEEPITFPIIID